MVIPEFYTDIIGIGITIAVAVIQWRKFKSGQVLTT
jgi:hypothetical protein